MDIQTIEDNLGRRFWIAIPGMRHFVAAVIRREQRQEQAGLPGWVIALTTRNAHKELITKLQVVTTEQIIELDEPYLPGDVEIAGMVAQEETEDAEPEEWEYAAPDGRYAATDLANDLELTVTTTLMPTILTGGFDLVSPVGIKVWMALFTHALLHPQDDSLQTGAGCIGGDDHGIPKVESTGLTGRWTAEQLAKAVGKKERSIHYALEELVQMGWINKAKIRATGGMVIGFSYTILPPPKKLTNIARTIKEEDAMEKVQDAITELRRVRRAK